MKQYYKDGKLVARPKSLIFGGCTYLNPRDEVLEKAGYEIKEYVAKAETNDDIRIKRQRAYRMRADQYLTAYQAYKELGQTEKALEMKELWLKEREAIDKEYPYLNKTTKTE